MLSRRREQFYSLPQQHNMANINAVYTASAGEANNNREERKEEKSADRKMSESALSHEEFVRGKQQLLTLRHRPGRLITNPLHRYCCDLLQRGKKTRV